MGSILLVREMLQPIAVFALLEAGCKEVYLVGDSVVGMEESDPPGTIEDVKRWAKSITPAACQPRHRQGQECAHDEQRVI